MAVAKHKRTRKTSGSCWKGYVRKGTKQKDGKTVPNCVAAKK